MVGRIGDGRNGGRNWGAHGEWRIGCRRTADDYRNGGADVGQGRRVIETRCLRCNSLDTDSLSPQPFPQPFLLGGWGVKRF
jgi:hypothetical protein